jgi:beta-glucosidase
LYGDVNPSGKLPVTFPVTLGDGRSEVKASIPVSRTSRAFLASYSEELLVGYRWYDAKGIQPLFPFGHGLSYTSFAYSGLKV